MLDFDPQFIKLVQGWLIYSQYGHKEANPDLIADGEWGSQSKVVMSRVQKENDLIADGDVYPV